MKIYYDHLRHLVTVPYNRETLHRAARLLEINRCWFSVQPYPHYDIPKRWVEDFGLKLDEQLLNLDILGIAYEQVSPREIVRIIKGKSTI
jgi:hypothetical protein